MRWGWMRFWQAGWAASQGQDSSAAALAPKALAAPFPAGDDIEDYQCPCCWKLLLVTGGFLVGCTWFAGHSPAWACPPNACGRCGRIAICWHHPAPLLPAALQNPVVTPCRHAFCQPCLRRWTDGMGKGSCPYCRAMLPLELPPVNRCLQRRIQRRFPQVPCLHTLRPTCYAAFAGALNTFVVAAGIMACIRASFGQGDARRPVMRLCRQTCCPFPAAAAQEAADRACATSPRQQRAKHADLGALLAQAGLQRTPASASRPKPQAAALPGHA